MIQYLSTRFAVPRHFRQGQCHSRRGTGGSGEIDQGGGLRLNADWGTTAAANRQLPQVADDYEDVR